MVWSKVHRMLFAGILATAGIVTGGAQAHGLLLASYRAVYDLSLDTTKSDVTVGDLSGRLVTEVLGSSCAGYKARLRFVTELEDSEGLKNVTDSRSTTFESGDGSTFRFTNETYSNDQLIERSAGTASRSATGVSVVLTKPAKKQITLASATAFPTQQMARLVSAASQGVSFLPLDVYDGSESGETVFATAAVIGAGSKASDDIGDETALADAGIAGLHHWPVTISYFDKAKTGDGTPFYVMSFVLYENGVGRKLRIDYGEFAINGRLAALEILPSKPCP